jgi:hypothetical protein
MKIQEYVSASLGLASLDALPDIGNYQPDQGVCDFLNGIAEDPESSLQDMVASVWYASVRPFSFVLVNEPATYSGASKAFWIAKNLVTWSQWKAVRAFGLLAGYSFSDSWDGESEHPVTSVSWYDAVKWCNALSEMFGMTPVYSVYGEVYRTGECMPDDSLSADGYRLPDPTDWNEAAQGGEKSRGYRYSGSNQLDLVGWYEKNSGGKTHPVGSKLPNELGIFDMSGNVWEWCFMSRMGSTIKGGSFENCDYQCGTRLAHEYEAPHAMSVIGFRVARNNV